VICFGPNDVADPPVPELLDYEQQIRPEVERRLGPRSALVNPFVGTMFPNFSMLRATSRTFRVWHPRGPEKTAVWSWVVFARPSPRRTPQSGPPSGNGAGLIHPIGLPECAAHGTGAASRLCREGGVVIPTYCNDTVMRMPSDLDPAMDRQLMRQTGRRLADGYLKDPPLLASRSNCELAAGERSIAEK
jgi:hypothetical protein